MKLIKKLDLWLTAVDLIDAHLCSDPGIMRVQCFSHCQQCYIRNSHMSMSCLRLIILRATEIRNNYSLLYVAAFNLDFYTDVEDLSYLPHHPDQDPRSGW